MKKGRIYLLIFISLIVVVVVLSYLLFVNGTTKKILASVNSFTSYVDDNNTYSNYPIITSVINSSGESLVNTDVAITINARSRFNIVNVEYSFDLKKWIRLDEKINDKEIATKMIFNKTINSDLYIRVVNEKGYKSYPYKTIVNIDKERPKLNISKSLNDVIIKTSDNVELSKIQYSYDKLNWDNMDISGDEVYVRKYDFNYLYVRVVDKAGNISNVKEFK